MNLYEIYVELMKAYDSAFDPETGEILDSEAFKAIDALEIERDKKIENIGCWIKNLDAEAAALKAEKMAFAERQKRTENKAESLRKYLSMFLNGEKFSTEKVAISFRKSESVVVDDEEGFIDWACATGRKDELIREKTITEIDKTALKAWLKEEDHELETAHLETKQNIQIK